MAHCELSMDSNIVDVSFNYSGSRIAVLTRKSFSAFSWPLKARPIPAPSIESNYPLPEVSFSRPRQITFLQDDEIIILSNANPLQVQVKKTKLETRITETIYCGPAGVQLYSVFPSLTHDKLWLASQPNFHGPTMYSIIAGEESDNFQTITWSDSPAIETLWAEATQTQTKYVGATVLWPQYELG